MRCYIVGAGEFYGFEEKPCAQDCVIAADGGYRVCLENGIAPDHTLGDFDSLGSVPDAPNLHVVPVEKDDTDMMLAARLGLELGHRQFHLYGGTGGRLDHTLANLQTLLFLTRRGAEAWLYDRDARFTVLENGTRVLPAADRGILSVFAVDGPAEKVTIRGGKYPLEDGTLTGDFPLGVSNHFVGGPITVRVERGAVLLCIYDNN